MNYEGFKYASTQLADLVEGQLSVVRFSDYDSVINTAEKPSLLLEEVKKRLKDENLRVLVMGNFSSGKSTFLNGLLGCPLLPMKAIPTTAVIGEIKYSDTEKIVLLPKKGKWQGGNAPFEISASDLGKYITIDHSDSENKENPFEKVFIHSPLPICKNGIEFVDSPGLNDPTSHDSVTKEYLPTADAIIYCMNSQAAYSAKDKIEIESLRSLGYTSIIFVLTCFDVLQDNDDMLGSNDAEELKDYMLKTLSPLTDLGESGIFFVNSIAAIKGKMKHDEELIQRSNFPVVEKRMEEILVNERGRIKIVRSLYDTKRINRRNGHYIADSITLANNKHLLISQQLNDALQTLAQTKNKANLIKFQLEQGISEIAKVAGEKGSLFLISDLIPNIENWVDEVEPNEEISLTDLKGSARKFTEAVVDGLKAKLNVSLGRWCNETLVKECVEKELSALLFSQTTNLSLYQNDLNTIKINLKLPIDGEEIVDKLSPSKTDNMITEEGGLFTGKYVDNITAKITEIQTVLTKQPVKIATGIVVGLVSILTPYGLSVLIGTALVSILGVGFVKDISIKSFIKNKIIAETKRLMIENKAKFSHEIYGEVRNILAKVQAEINDDLDGPINEAQRLVDEANTNMNTDGIIMQKKVQMLTQLKSNNDQIAADLDSFAETLTI